MVLELAQKIRLRISHARRVVLAGKVERDRTETHEAEPVVVVCEAGDDLVGQRWKVRAGEAEG